MSLRLRLLIFFIVVALIPLGLAGRTMVRLSLDELKSSANDEISAVANQVSQTMEDLYIYTWRAPARLVAEVVQSPALGVREKLAMLTEGMRKVPDIVAMQVAVEGVGQPLVVVQDEFAARLRDAGLEPFAALTVPNEKLFPIVATGEEALEPVMLPALGVWLVTIEIPLAKETFGKPAMLSATVNLERMAKRITEHPFTEAGGILVVDESGFKVFDRERSDLSRLPIVSKALALRDANNRLVGVEPYMKESGERMLGAFAFPLYFPWVIVVDRSEHDAYYAARKMSRHLMLWLGVGLAAAIAAAMALSVSLTKPLFSLMTAAGKIAGGDLETAVVGVERRDEIGRLSASFDKMVVDLKRYIHDLTETTRAKERAESELKLARNIQQSFLPKEFPRSDRFEVWGLCDPAREVGGDYFDFFQLDEKRYGLVIGDVSGKGVPASLFMAVSRTLFRILAADGGAPDKVLTEFNDRLVAMDQGSNMFITIFYGILNSETGEFTYSTAGHNMPFVSVTTNGKPRFEMLPEMKTMVAGIMDGMTMGGSRITFKPGDVAVFYTDGLVESINQQEEEYGEERYAARLTEWADRSAREICEAAVAELKEFQTGMPQFDDMTMIVLKMRSR